MKAKELKKLRELYTQQYDDLIKSISKSNEDSEIDIEGDAVDEIQGKSLARIANQLRQKSLVRLELIQSAIEKIDDGDYGDCEDCGETIGFKRLEAVPGAIACIVCAEQAENYR